MVQLCSTAEVPRCEGPGHPAGLGCREAKRLLLLVRGHGCQGGPMDEGGSPLPRVYRGQGGRHSLSWWDSGAKTRWGRNQLPSPHLSTPAGLHNSSPKSILSALAPVSASGSPEEPSWALPDPSRAPAGQHPGPPGLTLPRERQGPQEPVIWEPESITLTLTPQGDSHPFSRAPLSSPQAPLSVLLASSLSESQTPGSHQGLAEGLKGDPPQLHWSAGAG